MSVALSPRPLLRSRRSASKSKGSTSWSISRRPRISGARLTDAYQVAARIVVFIQDDTTIMPAGALFRRGDQGHVSVVKDGRAEIPRVQVLRRSGRSAAIVFGLNFTSGVRVGLRKAGDLAGGS